MRSKAERKRAQVWYADFAIGLLIFMVAIVGFMTYTYTEVTSDEEDLDSLIIDAKVIAASLVSEGYPADWNATNVTRVGLTDGDHRIDQSKLDIFSNLSYSDRAGVMGTTKDYYFYMQYANGTRFNILGQSGNESDVLVQVTRIVIYNNTMARMVFYLWQD